MADTNFEFEPNQMAERTSQLVKQGADMAADTAKTVKEKTQDFGRAAVNKIEENRVSAAGALHSVHFFCR